MQNALASDLANSEMKGLPFPSPLFNKSSEDFE